MGQGGGQLTATNGKDFPANGMSGDDAPAEYHAVPGVDFMPTPGTSTHIQTPGQTVGTDIVPPEPDPERPPVLDAIARSPNSPIFEALRFGGRRF